MSPSNAARVIVAILVLVAVAGRATASLKEGDPIPDLASFHLEGKLPDTLKGRVVLLDFWASWCGPCKQSFPAVQALHERYENDGLTVVAVSVDEKPEDMRRFLKEFNVSFAIVRDAGQKLVAAADVSSMPTSFVVDRAGRVRFVHNGFHGDRTVKRYREQIEQLLKEPAP